jgi:U3 small nucleolar RNA-associated protein 11
MSSFKNAFKGRAHKERSQPSSRKRLGFLEKKQDYQIRAKNFGIKKNKLKALKRRAALRNPDEFNFGMVNAHLEDGVHVSDKKEEKVPKEALLKRKDQDLQLVRLRERIEKKV